MADGRLFMPVAQYRELPEPEKARYWTLYREPRIVRELMLADLAGEAAVQKEKMQKRFSKLPSGGTASNGNPPSSAAAGGSTSPLPGTSGPASFDVSHFFS